jgi:hypothetical protein
MAFIGFRESEILRWKKASKNSRCVFYESNCSCFIFLKQYYFDQILSSRAENVYIFQAEIIDMAHKKWTILNKFHRLIIENSL